MGEIQPNRTFDYAIKAYKCKIKALRSLFRIVNLIDTVLGPCTLIKRQYIEDLFLLKSTHTANTRIWYFEERLPECNENCFDAAYWQQSGRVVGSADGRGTTWFVDLGQERGQAALRQYRRGGLLGKAIKQSYLFNGWEKTRSFCELQVLCTLDKAGVNVPLPIAAIATRHGFTYRAALLTGRIEQACDLSQLLCERELSSDVYYSIGQQIRRMHDAQVNHSDLNIHNILVDHHYNIWIIDFDKCYVQQGDGWKNANLERLQRSFLKEKNKIGIRWDNSDWEAILQGWSQTQPTA
jgi:3-deoxy-D-manno-octulosonic acid kinase